MFRDLVKSKLPAALVALFLYTHSFSLLAERIDLRKAKVSASSLTPGYAAHGAIDGDRFSVERGRAWKGAPGSGRSWWQVDFESPVQLGAILEILGEHPFVLQGAPWQTSWQSSEDGQDWNTLTSTVTTNEQRIFRVHRLPQVKRVRSLRFEICTASERPPTIRELEFYSEPGETISFPDWIVVVNTTDRPVLPGPGEEFIPLAKRCAGWSGLQAQQVWLAAFNEEFVKAEPKPLCAFLSGNFKDWCQVSREPWRGTQEVLQKKNLPIWASCGGAQGLAILAEVGVDHPWDCPHCRDLNSPQLPIYTHLGHTGVRPCGDYSACIFERGPHQVKRVVDDPAFKGLPEQFYVMESHCGQIEWPPPGWRLIATAGAGTETAIQCLRVADRYIYAAQFHIEMSGTLENSERIMGNFLGLAKQWGGWNPRGRIQ